MIKIRKFLEHNYKAIYHNGKTLRILLDPQKPITELKYPEFYDVKITGKCYGNCEYCYTSSTNNQEHYDVLPKIKEFFGNMTENQKPFQVAIGGGEPTLHPDFVDILKSFRDLGISPNYTTNGMWIKSKNSKEIIEATKEYCEGVAITCHAHLVDYWIDASIILINNGIFTNFHNLISDKESINYFLNIYDFWKGKVQYFVLLPQIAQGRCKKSELNWEYLKKKLEQYKDISDIAFGANFHSYLKKGNDFNVSLYEPEILSAYLDFKDMKVYKSSFSNEERKIG